MGWHAVNTVPMAFPRFLLPALVESMIVSIQRVIISWVSRKHSVNRECSRGIAARLFATSANLGASSKVLMVLRMTHTFVPATAANLRTGLEHQFHNPFIEIYSPYHHVRCTQDAPYGQITGCKAHVRTVQIHIDTVT